MIHARKDYQRIQDPQKIIPPDEPVFLIRGQDMLAIPTMECYILFAEKCGLSTDFINSLKRHIEKVDAWQQGTKSKFPDL